MTPQELKNSILQLAIQGKLVEQRPEEGTAEELYQQIRAEKQKLIREGKIKKEKPLPEITEEEKPFDIPDNWKWMRLDTLSLINGGYAFKSTDFCDVGTRVIRISDFNENGFVNTKIVRHRFHEDYLPFLLEPENILLCMTGGTVGKCLFIKRIDEPMMVNQRVATIKILSVLPLYVYYNIIAPFIQSVIQLSKNSTNDNISMETIKSFLIPLPPLAEQKRIVAKIEELLPLIDRYEKAWSRLEKFNKRFPDDMQKSILQLAIQGKLVEQRPEEGTGEELYQQIQAEKQKLIKEGKIKKDKPLPEITEEEKPFDIPDSWKWVRLDDLVIKEIKRGKSPTYTAQSNTLVFAQKCNTKAGYIDMSLALFLDESKLNKYPESEFMQEMDIVINSTGNGTLGRVGIFRNADNPKGKNIVPDSHVTVIRVNKSLCIKYIYYGLKHYQPFMEKLGSGSTNQTELSAGVVKTLLFPLPPLAEQKRIVAKIEELLPLCRELS